VIRAAVIGYGYWGPNIVRNLCDLSAFSVVGIADTNPRRCAIAQARYPAARVTNDAYELCRAKDVDYVVVSTPVHTHFSLATAALEAGKHVTVEKPMTSSPEEAKRLIDTAERVKRILTVDHTFVYTDAVRKMKSLIDGGTIGEPLYYDSVRANLGLFQSDVNVIWDLAVHDLSIVDYLFEQRPSSISAFGAKHVSGQQENMAYVTLCYETSLIVHLHVNWLAPVKLRRTLIGGSKKMIIYDDTEASEKVKVYDRGVDLEASPDGLYGLRVGYRSGDMYAPQVDSIEGLRIEFTHIAECIERGVPPITGGQAGLNVVSIVDAATRSMAARGRPLALGEQL
jgi:predicted dehydrogenase